MLCSATLLISNKYAVYKVAAPSFILVSQLMGTALVVKAFAAMGKIECDALEKQKVMKFMPVALIFLARIFSNMKSLQYANVETFMVFQLSTPLVVSIADYLLLGRKLPSPRSWGCLLFFWGLWRMPIQTRHFMSRATHSVRCGISFFVWIRFT